MSRNCTYHPVLERLVRALTTMFIILMGMATFNLTGCEPASGTLPDEDGVANNFKVGSAQDTQFVAANADQFVEDYALAQNAETAERYERWIALMDPFVTQNEDWTFTLNWEGFMNSIGAEYPDVVTHFNNKVNGLNPDIEVITILTGGITLANEYMLQQYEALQDLPEGAHAATWSYGYWWGRAVCYSGASAAAFIAAVTAGASLSAFVPGIGHVGAALAGAILSWVGYYYSVYGQFCISYTWGGTIWVSRY